MRYKQGHREESKAKILSAIGRGFRKHGYEGIGIDGLAKEAGLTSGAFYGHFSSKEEAFNETVIEGFKDLCENIEHLQSEQGENWIVIFIDFYLGTRRTCDLAESCALQTLPHEVARSSELVRESYQAEMIKVIEAVAKGLPQGTIAERRSRAWALMSLLSGGVTVARALADDALSAKTAKAIRSAALAIAKDNQG